MKYIFKILILFAFVNSLSAQFTVSGGFPRTLPNNPQFAKNHIDTTHGNRFYYKSPKWYFVGVVVSPTSPNDSVYTVSGVGLITVSYQNLKCRWYNTTSASYWNWTGTAWQNETALNVQNLLDSVNVWKKKNTFQDSLFAQKGMVSGGLIDTKGLNTEGSSTKAAATLKGVQADRDTVVANDFTLDGRYGTVGFNCSSAVMNCLFPATSGTVDWKFVIRNEDGLNDLVLKTSAGVEFYRIKSRMTVIFKNVNGTFKRVQ